MFLKYVLGVLLIICTSLLQAEERFTAPTFSLLTAGGQIALGDYKGKVVYLDFWASWCSPCRDSFPWMNAMQKKYADEGLVIIGINLDEHKKDAEQFLADVPANFIIAFDDKSATARKYELRAMPSAYVIGKDGTLLYAHIGFNNRSIVEYEKNIKQALSIQSAP